MVLKYVVKPLSYTLVFIAGFYLAVVWGWFRYSVSRQPTPYISLPKPVKVDPSSIALGDKWILSYSIYFVPLEGIDSKREYALIILKPLEHKEPLSISANPSRFNITGFKDKDSLLVVTLHPNQIASNPNAEYIHVIDFGGGLLSKHKVEPSDEVKMTSNYYP